MKIKTNIILTLLLCVTALILPTQAKAQTAGSSATMIPFITQRVEDNRVQILKSFLESYNSPLAPYAKVFIDEADKNNIDWKLVPAITGVESYFGQLIPPYSYNGWGYGVYGTHVRNFASWEEGISVVSHDLRNLYMNDWGAKNVYQIGALYAADPGWAYKVQHFIDLIDTFEGEKKNKALSISL